MKFILCIILYNCLCINVLFSQTYLTRQQAWEDIDEYFATIAKYHPNMYWHSSEEEVNDYISWIKRKCRDSMTVGEFNLYLCHSLHLFDEHTGINNVVYMPLRNDKIFPGIEYSNGKVFLKGCQLPIDSINSVSINKILAWKMELCGADWSTKYLNYVISKDYVFSCCVNDFDLQAPFRVCLRTPNGRDSVVLLEGEDNPNLKNSTRHETVEEKPYHFELYPRERIGIIRYNEIFWVEYYPEVDSVVSRFFQDCNKQRIKHLFFDVSRNGGGYGRQFCMFFPYLRMSKSECYQRDIRTKTERYWDCCQVDSQKTGIKPFKGKIYVYQGLFSQSGTPDFCAIMKVLAKATLVGTETGSGIPQYTTGWLFNLKHSGLECRVAKEQWISERPRLPRTPEGYLLPDVEYPVSQEHLLNVQDCRKIIEKAKN